MYNCLTKCTQKCFFVTSSRDKLVTLISDISLPPNNANFNNTQWQTYDSTMNDTIEMERNAWKSNDHLFAMCDAIGITDPAISKQILNLFQKIAILSWNSNNKLNPFQCLLSLSFAEFLLYKFNIISH